MRRQAGFFDVDDRLKRLSDPLQIDDVKVPGYERNQNARAELPSIEGRWK
jgi:hypothetical protein